MRSDTQLCILTAAAAREDGRAFPFPAHLTGDTDREATLLVESGLLEYRRPTIYDSVWKQVRGRGNVTAYITPAGEKYINI